MSGARSIEADRAEVRLDRGDLVRLDEEDLGAGIQESPDEPARGRAVDMDSLPRHPFHADSSVAGGEAGKKRAAQSVPATPRAPAARNVKAGRMVQSAPPTVAAPATAKPRIA